MKILKVISELLFPWKCVFCDCVLENADICSDCEKNLPYTKGDSIYQKFPFVEKCVTPLYYKDKVRESIHLTAARHISSDTALLWLNALKIILIAAVLM